MNRRGYRPAAARDATSVPVGPWRRFRALISTSWWLFRPLLILCALGLLFVVSFVAYTHFTAPDTYWREFAIAMIGTLLTVSGSFAVALYAFRDQLRRRREVQTLRRFDDETWRRRSLVVGGMRIPDIMVVASCRLDRDWTDHARIEWEPALTHPRPQDPLATRAREERLPSLLARARKESIAFTDDGCVDLASARVDLEQREGARRPVYRLTPTTATYYDFATTAANLDAPLEGDDSLTGTSLRHAWGLDLRSLEDVQDLPCMAKVGVGTAVVTKDDRLVLGVRGRTMIAGSGPISARGRSKVHIVAEGMVPGDLDADGRIDPRETSIRGLHEELLIGGSSRDLGRVIELHATGFYVDQLRMQPCFAYLARTDLTWDELASAAPSSQDFWEVSQLIDLPFDVAHVGLRRLLLGKHPDMEFASNHAAATVWFACLHRFGFHRMRDVLSIPLPPQS